MVNFFIIFFIIFDIIFVKQNRGIFYFYYFIVFNYK